jgi:acyl dehydratase
MVGLTVGPVTHEIDVRWMAAYAAGLGESDPRFYETRRSDGPLAHPLFPVCYEWPLALQVRERSVAADVELRAVHAFHDLLIHRPPRAGDRLTTTARVIAIVRRPPGALRVVRYETVDDRGEPVTTTEYGSIYRGVDVEGPDRQLAAWTDGEPALIAPGVVARVEVPATMAHVYTECARIWNPIHTDPAVAARVGLPGIVLHGTATLALAVSRLLQSTGRDPAAVRRVGCRFTGMVRLPSAFTVRAGVEGELLRFDASADDGRSLLGRGILRAG